MAPSVVSALATAAVLSSAALLAPVADAHSYVILPQPTWTSSDRDVWYAPLAFLEDQGFATQEDFNAWRRANGYKTLRAFMDTAKYTVTSGSDYYCGNTKADGTVQPIPANFRSTGYTHDGPCEVWLDSKRIYANDNCHAAITGKDTAVDYSSCTGTCTLRWYWLGVRYLNNAYSWQVYKNCVRVSPSARRLEGAANESAIILDEEHDDYHYAEDEFEQ
jgi:hypothetical protein